MKKFLFIFVLSLSAMAVEPVTHSEVPGLSIDPNVNRTSLIKVDKAAKLEQYINACLIQRPGPTDEIKKLLQ